MTRLLPLALAAALAATPALAEAEKYVLDSSHSQIVFSYSHLGFSTSYGMFSGFEGEIAFDQANPAASSVSVAFPVRSMLTGWQARFDHFMSPDFLDAAEDEMVSFTSTAIEVTGEKTAKITGDLTLNGVTKPVVLDVAFYGAAKMPKEMGGQDMIGFEADATIKRSDFGISTAIPLVSDEVQLDIVAAFVK